jgi:hypothetical protein
MDLSYLALAISHLDSLVSCFLQWFKNDLHRFMKETLHSGLDFKVSHLLPIDFLDGKIANEDTCMLRWLPSNGFGKIADSKVYGISGLISRELGKLSFIRGDNNGCHCSMFGNFLLQYVSIGNENKYVSHLKDMPPLSCPHLIENPVFLR